MTDRKEMLIIFVTNTNLLINNVDDLEFSSIICIC